MQETVISPSGNIYVPPFPQYSYVTKNAVISLFHVFVLHTNYRVDQVAKQSKQRWGILKWHGESTSCVFHTIWLCFYLQMSHNIYHMSSQATTRIFAPWWEENPGALCHPLPSAASGLIFLYVTLEAMWYMYVISYS